MPDPNRLAGPAGRAQMMTGQTLHGHSPAGFAPPASARVPGPRNLGPKIPPEMSTPEPPPPQRPPMGGTPPWMPPIAPPQAPEAAGGFDPYAAKPMTPAPGPTTSGPQSMLPGLTAAVPSPAQSMLPGLQAAVPTSGVSNPGMNTGRMQLAQLLAGAK